MYSSDLDLLTKAKLNQAPRHADLPQEPEQGSLVDVLRDWKTRSMQRAFGLMRRKQKKAPVSA